MKLLHDRITDKKEITKQRSLWIGVLTIMAAVPMVVAIANPTPKSKSLINGWLLLFGTGCAVASLVVEHSSSEDFEALQKALEYMSGIEKEKVKSDVMMTASIADLALQEEAFKSVPTDAWGELSRMTGVTPPNLEARRAMSAESDRTQNSVAVQSIKSPVATIPIEDVDPCSEGYEPEEASKDSFIFAKDVEKWFGENDDRVPEEFKTLWRSAPGIAVSVEKGQIKIVGGNNE